MIWSHPVLSSNIIRVLGAFQGQVPSLMMLFTLSAVSRLSSSHCHAEYGESPVVKFHPKAPLLNGLPAGVSLGGYLGTRGCAVYSDRLTACIANPPRYSLTDIYDGFVQSLGAKTYAPFLYVQENNASLLSIQYQESWDNYNEIAYSLLLTCNASSAAPQLINDAFKATSGKATQK